LANISSYLVHKAIAPDITEVDCRKPSTVGPGAVVDPEHVPVGARVGVPGAIAHGKDRPVRCFDRGRKPERPYLNRVRVFNAKSDALVMGMMPEARRSWMMRVWPVGGRPRGYRPLIRTQPPINPVGRPESDVSGLASCSVDRFRIVKLNRVRQTVR
jgi:hypothetical protein